MPAAPMLVLPFDTDNVLKSVIRNTDDNSRRYGVETYHGGSARLETCIENRVGTICAVIDWKQRTFKVGTNTVPVDGMKRRASALSAVRYWRWLEGEEYTVRYSNSADTWSIVNGQNEILAELKSCVSPIFGQTTLPVLRLSPLVRNEDDRLFFLLVLLYSEGKRVDHQG